MVLYLVNKKRPDESARSSERHDESARSSDDLLSKDNISFFINPVYKIRVSLGNIWL